MPLINIDFNQQSNNLNVPILRQTKMTAWVNFFVKQLGWLFSRFNDYTNGSNYPKFNLLTTYSINNIVRYGNNNYAFIYPNPTLGPFPTNTIYWYKLAGDFIGADEHLKMNGQKLMFEYALNRWFGIAAWSTVQWTGTPGYTQIYIKRNLSSNSNYWLSNGGAGSLTSFMANSNNAQFFFLGNSYSTYNPYRFTIYVPNAILTAITLPPGITDAKTVIADFATKYTRIGKKFNVIGY